MDAEAGGAQVRGDTGGSEMRPCDPDTTARRGSTPSPGSGCTGEVGGKGLNLECTEHKPLIQICKIAVLYMCAWRVEVEGGGGGLSPSVPLLIQ